MGIKTLTALGVVLFGLALPWAVNAEGFGFDKNRLVIQNGKLSGSFTLKNENQSGMLIRAHVENSDQMLTKQAMARPRLFQVQPGGTGRIRVDVNPKNLPSDRETQFWLYTKAFPAVDLTKESNQIQINFVTRLKVFYRPAGIEANYEEAVRNIRWVRENGRLVGINDSPLNLTIVSLFMDGQQRRVSHVMKPFSRWVSNISMKSNHLRWQSINDFGATVDYEGKLQ